MAFLDKNQVKYFEDLAVIPNVNALTRNGNPKKVKAFLLGPNKCRLSNVFYREGKKCTFIQVVFERDKATTSDGKRLTFAPLKEVIFSNELDRINELSSCFGHSLPTSLPDGYTIESFLRALCMRLHTFIGKELIVNVSYGMRVIRDDYGDILYHIDQDYKKRVKTPIVVSQPKVISFGEKQYDWNMCRIEMSQRDIRDNIIITEQKEVKQ